MKIKKKSPGEFGIDFGLILGAFMIGISGFMYLTDMAFEGHQWPVYIYYIVFPIMIIYCISKFKKQNLGLLSVSEAIKTGIIVALISALIYVLYIFVFNSLIDPGYNEKIIEFSTNEIAKSDAPVEVIEDRIKMIEFFTDPINASLFWVAMSLFFGLIYSLIGGLAMKKTEA